MKKMIFLLLVTWDVHAMTVYCRSGEMHIEIELQDNSEIAVTYQGEKTFGDGLVDMSEIDLVAKFPRSGEMTLFAKLGKSDPENYLYFLGKRNSVICR